MMTAVQLCDNVGCDVLLRLLGAPEAVENYMHKNGFNDFAVKINEEVMQSNWDMKFLNWTTPNEINKILEAFYVNTDQQLSREMHDFLWKTMESTAIWDYFTETGT